MRKERGASISPVCTETLNTATEQYAVLKQGYNVDLRVAAEVGGV